jgi:hypothetical protein
MQEMNAEIANVVFQEHSYVTLSICYARVDFSTNKLISISYSHEILQDVSKQVDQFKCDLQQFPNAYSAILYV